MSYLHAYRFARNSGRSIFDSIGCAIRIVSSQRRRERTVEAARRQRIRNCPF